MGINTKFLPLYGIKTENFPSGDKLVTFRFQNVTINMQLDSKEYKLLKERL